MKHSLPSVTQQAASKRRGLSLPGPTPAACRPRRRIIGSAHAAGRTLGGLLVVLAVGLPSAAQEQPGETAASSAATVDGPALVAQAARQVSEHPSLEAKMRQRLALFDQYVVGSGTYTQLRHRDGTRFQLELRLQVGDQLTSLQQLNDGRYLWIRRDLGPTQSLGRIDLERVRAALSDGDRPATLASPTALSVGGLAQLLQGLSDNFDFAAPVSEEISRVPVWRIVGRWKTEVLGRLLPEQVQALVAGQAAQTDKLAPHLPDQVVLVLGRDPKVLPLFPYRLEFTRRDAKSGVMRTILAMELFEVRLRPDLDPRQFSFQLGEQRVEDETQDYLDKLGLSETE